MTGRFSLAVVEVTATQMFVGPSDVGPPNRSLSPNADFSADSNGFVLYQLLCANNSKCLKAGYDRPVKAWGQSSLKRCIHSSTPHRFTPRPRAIIPPVLFVSEIRQNYGITARTYLVPTIRSKKSWIGTWGPSSFWMALRSTSSTIPRTPPLFLRSVSSI